jgi:hypothetical protein
MTRPAAETPTRSGSDGHTIVQTVTVIMGTVIGLTFLFGFGNVLNLALRLDVSIWVAPLVAPAVDLSILGLLLGTRHLALAGATAAQLQPARRLLFFASVVALALNVADPIVTGHYGKAAFDAVGPLLLIGWAEVGPALLQAINTTRTTTPDNESTHNNGYGVPDDNPCMLTNTQKGADDVTDSPTTETPIDDELLDRARHADVQHWADHRRPISAATLRRTLRISAARARLLVTTIRNEHSPGRDTQAAAVSQSRFDDRVDDPLVVDLVARRR